MQDELTSFWFFTDFFFYVKIVAMCDVSKKNVGWPGPRLIAPQRLVVMMAVRILPTQA